MKYTHWRKPDTRLESNDDNAAPLEILKWIGESAKSPDGVALQWGDIEITHYTDCLRACVAIIGPDRCLLNEHDTADIVSRATSLAIHESGVGNSIRQGILRKHLERLSAEYFSREKREWQFVTSFSIGAPIPSDYSVLGLSVEPCNRADYPPPSVLTDIDSYVTPHVSGSRYKSVRVSISSRSPEQAFEDGLRACDLLLGIWNHIASYSYLEVFDSVPRRHYVSRIHPSPIATLHDSNGETLDLYSYRREYHEDIGLYQPSSSDWTTFHAAARQRLHLVEVSPFREELITLFSRYANAIVQPDHGVVFMMLWSILERITGTIGHSYEELTKRAAWPFADRQKNINILRVCQLKRNLYVHSSQSCDRQLQFCFMLKKFVDAHLRILLSNRFHVSSLQQYGDLLALPADPGVLKDRVQKYRKALRYLGHEDDD